MTTNTKRPGDLKQAFNGGRVKVNSEAPELTNILRTQVDEKSVYISALIIGTEQFVVKYDHAGKLDDSFADSGRLNLFGMGAGAFDNQGRILHSYALTGASIEIRRYLSSGLPDYDFGKGGVCIVDISHLNATLRNIDTPSKNSKRSKDNDETKAAADFGLVEIITGQGELYLVATVFFNSEVYNGTLVARITESGHLDEEFGNQGFFVYRPTGQGEYYFRGASLDKTLSNLTLLVYEVPSHGSEMNVRLIRVTPEGALDPEFKSPVIKNTANNISQGPFFDAANTLKVVADIPEGRHLFGWTHQGDPDPEFNNGKPLELKWPNDGLQNFFALASQGQGDAYRIVHAGYSDNLVSINRMGADGVPDTTFGENGSAKFTRNDNAILPPYPLVNALKNNEILFTVWNEVLWVVG
ncbi:hypothetical protein [Pseudomonas sp. H9]|uniref:hypothetical protein n=1 Tax=Pseudomonas sp. H9 TaxID=483968 RepID=UPI00105838B1|nr:hypothetical protein [Pseudomonas sp. H9]TDF81157.1 hypothetical protein E1573_18220 [Pseudomonas sp. H9]